MKIIVGIYRGLVCYLGMTLMGLIGSTLYLLSFGKLRRFNAEVMIPWTCSLMLKLIGIEVDFSNLEKLPQDKVIYMFNHNSFLDIFIIPLLKLHKTRPLISTRTRKILPLYLSNVGLGAWFIPFKDRPEKRLEFLRSLSEKLKNGNDNIICAPEGVHTFRHAVAKFNKGIFHTAMVSGRPICPIFFRIPKESNPLESYFFKAGKVKVEVMPVIETKNWSEENLDQHISDVRNLFVNKFNQEFGASIQ